MRLHILTALLVAAPWVGAAAQDPTQTQTQPQDTTRQANDDRWGQLSDDAVLMRLHHTNQLEVKAGQLAQRNGSSAKVKAFGARLVRDHQAADQKVVALAKRLNISLTRGPGDSTGRQYGRDGRYDRPRSDSAQRTDTTNRWQDRRDSTDRSDTTGRMGRMDRSDTTGQMGRMGHMGDERGEMKNPEQELQRLGTLRGAAFDTAFANAMVEGHQKAISMLERAQNQVQRDEVRTLITSTLPTLRQHLQTAQSLTNSTSTSSSQ